MARPPTFIIFHFPPQLPKIGMEGEVKKVNIVKGRVYTQSKITNIGFISIIKKKKTNKKGNRET